jgi:hypothetical protein
VNEGTRQPIRRGCPLSGAVTGSRKAASRLPGPIFSYRNCCPIVPILERGPGRSVWTVEAEETLRGAFWYAGRPPLRGSHASVPRERIPLSESRPNGANEFSLCDQRCTTHRPGQKGCVDPLVTAFVSTFPPGLRATLETHRKLTRHSFTGPSRPDSTRGASDL